MSGDELCVGVCVIDWDEGICQGCGRTTSEIYGETTSAEEAPPPPAGHAPTADAPPAAGESAHAGKDGA
ncbi:DUF1289 domain-containing protein [Thauera linaloolentis]|uniref:DUF1289 domain-containing protein n=1 Tax=Thauera linaloolentis (strain DSM 12138 / JCM 21573 / CCUG 41526 / CIP 105981 / IAM 15112 / NBRC 102519 / 47Lol) TaxID=1123367 RepID=N6Z7S2_THAL4|nr:DUF1289 domain-containing protein [Thauera linaloolentis]ENO88219.1 hypothetical protein C666_09165 [Thauera linaloolentis 47Lol = DSM 12138]MCM8566864.1 DUF1289 domain-containing protein [Thauera linaloolentis]